MSETALDRLVDRFLAHHATFNPVDATFMGLLGYDSRLPPAGIEAAEHERAGIAGMLRDLDGTPVGDAPGQRLDARMLRAALIHAAAALDHWPRFLQPSWYTGEVAFGVISLLLPTGPAGKEEGLSGRLDGVPTFLDRGQPRSLVRRPRQDGASAHVESAGPSSGLLTGALPRHPFWTEALAIRYC